MKPILVSLALLAPIPVLMLGCSGKPFKKKPYFVTKNEPWRARDERMCLASGAVRATAFLVPRARLNGPKTCGALRPFSMRAALDGRVQLQPAALVACPMVPAFERWVREVVDPAARYHYGQPVRRIKVLASYSCRPINSRRGGRLSEHGHANALDIGSFTLADGRVVTVKGGWRGRHRDRRFLRDIHKGGCAIFYTVLGPNYNRLHHDHFHLDLARHGKTGAYRVCR